MSTPDKTEQRKSGKFTTGEVVSEREFKRGIKEAEKGPFYSVQESMKYFEEWLKKRKNIFSF